MTSAGSTTASRSWLRSVVRTRSTLLMYMFGVLIAVFAFGARLEHGPLGWLVEPGTPGLWNVVPGVGCLGYEDGEVELGFDVSRPAPGSSSSAPSFAGSAITRARQAVPASSSLW